jgi:hypothetical protein
MHTSGVFEHSFRSGLFAPKIPQSAPDFNPAGELQVQGGGGPECVFSGYSQKNVLTSNQGFWDNRSRSPVMQVAGDFGGGSGALLQR